MKRSVFCAFLILLLTVSLFAGMKMDRQEVNGHFTVSIRSGGRWMPVDRPTLGRRGLRTQRYTYVENRMPGEPVSCELYDRTEDPYQMVELSGQRPGVVRELSEQLARRLEESGARWMPTCSEAVL